jgi:undecaprenyl-diphosphatase
MTILTAAILGVLQGLTEFLPISSSAHLILVPWFLGWQPMGLVFDVSVHFGTAIAVLAFFWKDWVRLCKALFTGFLDRDPFGNQDRKLAWFLIVGTLPAVVAGLLFEELIETKLRSPMVTVYTLAGLGILLFIAEMKSRRNRTLQVFAWADCLWIGFSQVLALVPGVSRSGITMTAALFRNAARTDAARFSFLLSTPVILGASILAGWRLIQQCTQAGDSMAPIPWEVLVAGVLSASITGFLCIRYFLRYLQTKSFVPFVIYRFLLAGVVLIFYLRHH